MADIFAGLRYQLIFIAMLHARMLLAFFAMPLERFYFIIDYVR